MTWKRLEEFRNTTLPLTGAEKQRVLQGEDKALLGDETGVDEHDSHEVRKSNERAALYRLASVAWRIIRNTLLILGVLLGAFMGTTFAYSVIVRMFPSLLD